MINILPIVCGKRINEINCDTVFQNKINLLLFIFVYLTAPCTLDEWFTKVILVPVLYKVPKLWYNTRITGGTHGRFRWYTNTVIELVFKKNEKTPNKNHFFITHRDRLD